MTTCLHVLWQVEFQEVSLLVHVAPAVLSNNGIGGGKVSLGDQEILGELRSILNLSLLSMGPIDPDKTRVPIPWATNVVVRMAVAPVAKLEGFTGGGGSSGSTGSGNTRLLDGIAGRPVRLQLPEVVARLGDPVTIVDLVPGETFTLHLAKRLLDTKNKPNALNGANITYRGALTSAMAASTFSMLVVFVHSNQE